MNEIKMGVDHSTHEKRESLIELRSNIRKNEVEKGREPTNSILYPDELPFIKPVQPTYSLSGSILSMLSLAIMSVALIYFISQFSRHGPETFAEWVYLPFWFSLFGAGLGCLFELGLILSGTPFQQHKNRFTSFIATVRVTNISPVLCLMLFFTVCMSIPEESLRIAMMYTLFAFAAGLGFASFFFKFPPPVLLPVIFLSMQVLMGVIVLIYGVDGLRDMQHTFYFVLAAVIITVGAVILLKFISQKLFGLLVPVMPMIAVLGSCLYIVLQGKPDGVSIIALLLIGQAVAQFNALTVGTGTPLKSTFFHLTVTIGGYMAFKAIMALPDAAVFSQFVAPSVPSNSLAMWLCIASALIGLIISFFIFPYSYFKLRTRLSNLVWSSIYFLLVGNKSVMKPVNLTNLYQDIDDQDIKKTQLKPYYVAHPEYLINQLSIPSVPTDQIERNVLVGLKDAVSIAQPIFKLIAFLDHYFPQAKVSTPIGLKERMPVWSDGSEYWPAIFKLKTKLFALPEQAAILDKLPQPAIDEYMEGQLLAYLAESGVAAPMTKKVPSLGDNVLSIDMRFLEKYETKEDYEPYGGVAYFEIDNEKKKLKLTSIIAPNGTKKIQPDPHDPTFRHAERQVLASIYYWVVSGKHLAEIHMTYNLVEVSMHNAFDAKGQYAHPFRTFLYLHFYSHELAEEITTEHLVQEGAVFSQMFATTHDAMIQHLNDTYTAFEYGEDEEIETRIDAMTMSNGELLPKSCIKWEKDYFDVWQRYSTNIVDGIYEDDEAVQSDQHLQDFYKGLLQVLLKGLPQRYEEFKTKRGIARFSADTIHHMVIRHQVYGTTGVRTIMDPRISSTLVPKDTGPLPVDEWRSLIGVATATAYARFTLLTGPDKDEFFGLLDGVESKFQVPMLHAFNTMQEDLEALEVDWTGGTVEEQKEKARFNYDYFRTLPSAIHTGPGY